MPGAGNRTGISFDVERNAIEISTVAYLSVANEAAAVNSQVDIRCIIRRPKLGAGLYLDSVAGVRTRRSHGNRGAGQDEHIVE